MNKQNIARIIADPAALTALQKCATVNELVARLNRAGAECTREEGLRFLRTWERMAAARESLDDEALSNIAGGRGITGRIRSMFSRDAAAKHRFSSKDAPDPLTIQMILDHMNC